MIDLLEQRRLFSIAVVSGVLTVNGSSASDVIYVSWKQTSSTSWDLRVSDGSTMQLWGWSGRNSWNSISLYGANGADTIRAADPTTNGYSNTIVAPVPTTINGGAGNDTCYGTDSADTLLGGSGSDVLHALQGNDYLDGQNGSDALYAGNGADILEGREANTTADPAVSDYMCGESQDDHFYYHIVSATDAALDVIADYRADGDFDVFHPTTI